MWSYRYRNPTLYGPNFGTQNKNMAGENGRRKNFLNTENE
jgi:hypothetical protein